MFFTFKELRSAAKSQPEQGQPLRIALLGDSATPFLKTALEGQGKKTGFLPQVYESDYDQIAATILNTSSPLYTFQPEFVWLAFSLPKIQLKYFNNNKIADAFVQEVREYLQILQENTNAKILINNFPVLPDAVFGNYGNNINTSLIYQLRKINLALMDLAGAIPNTFIVDVNALQSEYGREAVFDSKYYIASDLSFSLNFLPVLVKNVYDVIQSNLGFFKKCLILDLDNTLWGGVIGDDGIEGIQIGNLGIGKAFSGIQRWVKNLKERGIILAVCSKNTEHIALEPFENHPEMILKKEDFAIFVANWENKADNIRHIQQVLNIGFDSMVFLDDNPFEREWVRENLPEVSVPELPKDPAQYLKTLRRLNLFETASHAKEDKTRVKKYQEEARRMDYKKSYSSLNEYLKSLNMKAVVAPFDKLHFPRIAQLSQRSNQFNLRTIRYSEKEIETIASNGNFISLYIKLEDKFGDYGLISIVILEKQLNYYFIDTWIMSCRVLKRGVEGFTLNQAVEKVKALGGTKIVGEYLPTRKNGIVEDLYKNLGFIEKNNLWELDVLNYNNKKCFIIKNNE